MVNGMMGQPRLSGSGFSKGKVPSSGFRVQRLWLLEIPNRRWFDVFQPGTLNREPFYFVNLKPGIDQFRSEFVG
jgi:hypothetical protein